MKTLSMRVFTCLSMLLAALWAMPSFAANLVVGGKNFTEQQLLAEITVQLLQSKGMTVDKKDGISGPLMRQAQESGQIDVVWEYTGTSLITYNKFMERLSPEDSYKKVKELDAAKGLVWLNPSQANNTYTFAMNQDDAKKLGIVTLSDLAKVMNGGKTLALASSAEFYARPDGLRPLEKAYNFKFEQDQVKRMASGLTYQALKDRQVDVALVFATDGRIPAFNFVTLQDDKVYFPAYALTPVVRKTTLDVNPGLAPTLNALAAKLDDATMADMNAQIDIGKKSFSDVAKDFLAKSGLVSK